MKLGRWRPSSVDHRRVSMYGHEYRRGFLTFLCLTLAACGSFKTQAIIPAPTNIPLVNSPTPSLAGWTLAWDDEFDGNTLNTQHWATADTKRNVNLGCCLRFGMQSWSPQNVIVENGYLHFLTKADANASHTFSSGAISTEGIQSFLYGRIDVRAQLPRSTSLWPAFWLIPTATPGQKVAAYEIDFMEAWESDPYTVNAFFHWGYQQSYCDDQGPNFTDSFHVFTLIWEPGSLQWLVDGTSKCTITSHVPDIPLYLIMDTALGGPSEPIDQTTILPQNTYITSIRDKRRPPKSGMIG